MAKQYQTLTAKCTILYTVLSPGLIFCGNSGHERTRYAQRVQLLMGGILTDSLVGLRNKRSRVTLMIAYHLPWGKESKGASMSDIIRVIFLIRPSHYVLYAARLRALTISLYFSSSKAAPQSSSESLGYIFLEFQCKNICKYTFAQRS